MKLNKDILKKIISKIPHTRKDEIGCDECFDKLHIFADMALDGKSPEIAMPLIKEHLENCGECRQEYQALLEAMKLLNKEIS